MGSALPAICFRCQLSAFATCGQCYDVRCFFTPCLAMTSRRTRSGRGAKIIGTKLSVCVHVVAQHSASLHSAHSTLHTHMRDAKSFVGFVQTSSHLGPYV